MLLSCAVVCLVQEEEVLADPEGEGAGGTEAPPQETGQGQARLGPGLSQGIAPGRRNVCERERITSTREVWAYSSVQELLESTGRPDKAKPLCARASVKDEEQERNSYAAPLVYFHTFGGTAQQNTAE